MDPVKEENENNEENEKTPAIAGEISEELIQQLLGYVLPYSTKVVNEFIELLAEKDITPVIKVDPKSKRAYLTFIKNSGFESFTVKKDGVHSVLDLKELAEAAKNEDFEQVRALLDALGLKKEDNKNSENES